MTREQIASAIRTRISNGLKEVYNHTYSIPQLEDEVGATRNKLILEYSINNPMYNLESFAQKKDNIALDLIHPPFGGFSAGPKKVHHFKMPRLAMTSNNSSLIYVGPPDFSINFKKYFDVDFTKHKYMRVISNKPYVYIDEAFNNDDMIDAYIYNLGVSNLREVSIRGVFANPYSLYDTDPFADEIEFPAPIAVQDQIIDILAAKYVEYYRKLHMSMQPNTQTETNK